LFCKTSYNLLKIKTTISPISTKKKKKPETMSENSFNLAYYLQLSALLHAAKAKLRKFLSSLFPPHFTRLLPSLFPFQVWCMNDASFIDGFSFKKLSGLNLTLGALGESPDALQLSSQPRVLPFLYYYSKFLRFFF
jgi:hypothetical protein